MNDRTDTKPLSIHYKVCIHLKTLENSPQYFDHEEEFKGSDILFMRQEAVKYFCEQANGIEKKGDFFGFPITAYKDMVKGQTAAYSIYLFYIVDWGESESEWCLYGDGELEQNLDDQAWEIVTLIDLGLNPKEISPLLFPGIDKRRLQDEVNSILKDRHRIQPY